MPSVASSDHLNQLLLESLEHERGGILVYEAALECVLNEDLRAEWSKYLDQTRNHESILIEVCKELKLDPDTPTPGREIVQHLGSALVEAMEMALEAGDRAAAERVACECVVLAETKDHMNWELLGKAAEHSAGSEREALIAAVEEVEDQEDEHLYHSRGWARELWLDALGLDAILPPPEERLKVRTAIGAARAEQIGNAAR